MHVGCVSGALGHISPTCLFKTVESISNPGILPICYSHRAAIAMSLEVPSPTDSAPSTAAEPAGEQLPGSVVGEVLRAAWGDRSARPEVLEVIRRWLQGFVFRCAPGSPHLPRPPLTLSPRLGDRHAVDFSRGRHMGGNGTTRNNCNDWSMS